MITKNITGTNTPFFVEYANDLISKNNINNIVADIILDAYENGVDPIQLKDYIISTINHTTTLMMIMTETSFNEMISERNKGKFNLCDDEVLACAAYEARGQLTND